MKGIHFLWLPLCARAVLPVRPSAGSLRLATLVVPRGGGAASNGSTNEDQHDAVDEPGQPQRLPYDEEQSEQKYGRISDDEFRLTPEQIETFRRQGCVTIPNVLNSDEVTPLMEVFDRFIDGEITVPGKDFCDMSKAFGIPYSDWSIVNCMLPTTYYPPLRGNVFERLTQSMARQLFPSSEMVKDYDQFLNKRPGKEDAVFAWHQDMAYLPSPECLGVKHTDTCTFSLALDNSVEANGCLRYIAGSGVSKTLRPHQPLAQSREDGHALSVEVDTSNEHVRLAPALSGSVTIHDEYVVHGSAGNTCPDRQRRTYVLAYRDREIVEAERRIGFSHSHNDQVNWDTFVSATTRKNE